MKRLFIIAAIVLALSIASPALAAAPNGGGLTISNGVDLFRGSWQGQATLPTDIVRQINLYFNEFAADPDNMDSFKASGYFSNDQMGGKKRADAPKLPMMASCQMIDSDTCQLIILANFQLPPELGSGTTIAKFVGTAEMGGSGVTDDAITGTWYIKQPGGNIVSGPWSAKHLDRRNVKAPSANLNDPTLGLYLDVDTCAILDGPGNTSLSPRISGTILQLQGNIVMNSVKVIRPDGSSIGLPQYTDVFSPYVNWITQFRFSTCDQGMPIAGGTYTFIALDVAGNPIPGIQATDVWVGVEPPNAPSNVQAILNTDGILMSWDASPVIADSFDPASDLGFYQIEVRQENNNWEEAFGANRIGDTSHLIPADKTDFVLGQDYGIPLNEMNNGNYSISLHSFSMAPNGSAGHGLEYNNLDSTENVLFSIEDGVITILE